MSVQNPFDQTEKKLPSLLNVLTILTMVGCAVELLFGSMNVINGRKNLDKLEELQSSGQLDNAPAFMKKFAGPEAMENARLAYENRIPLFVMMLAGIALCLYGALQMRKLQKTGFYMWLIGELLPTIGSIILIGLGFAGNAGWMMIFPALFIILCITQLKYMK